MAWIEGFTSSTEILKTIARNTCTIFKDAAGNLIPGKNWEMVFPSPLKYRTIKRVIQEVLSSRDYQLYNTAYNPIAQDRIVRIFREGTLVNPAEYTINYQAGSVFFTEIQRHIESVEGETAAADDNYQVYTLPHDEIIGASLTVYRDGSEVDPVEYIFNALEGKITFRFQQSDTAVITADYEYLGEPYELLMDYTYYTDVNEVTGEVLNTSDGIVFSTQNGNLTEGEVTVYRNQSYVSPSEYTIDRRNGNIIFHAFQSNVVSVADEMMSSTDYLVFSTAHKPMTFTDPIVVYREGMQVQPTEYLVDRVNGTITFQNVQRRIVQITQGLTTTTDYKIYAVAYSPVIPGSMIVYRNAELVSSMEYTINYESGTIAFDTQQQAEDVITVDYAYYGTPFNITINYSYFKDLVALQDVSLATTNYIVYSTGHHNVLAQNLVVKRDGIEVDPSEYTLNITDGTITFGEMQSPTAVITASFVFCPQINYIVADYSYYASLIDIMGEALVPVNNQLFYTSNRPVSTEHTLMVYKNDLLLEETEFTMDYQTGTVVVSEPVEATDRITIDYSYFTDGIEEAIAATVDRLVIKTTTTPVELTEEQRLQNMYSDERLNITSLTMYVEFMKPSRLINPETGTEYYKDHQLGLYVRAGANHHYVNVRMFDQWDSVLEEPIRATYDSAGRLLQPGAAVSPWSKLAWFRDWEEVPLAYVTESPSDDKQIGKGPLFRPVKFAAALSEIPIRYWMSVSNDRVIAVLMGEPSAGYQNYIMSFAYIGRIKPNESGVNDTYGNFALTTASSTVPCKITAPPTDRPIISSATLSTTSGQLLGQRTYYYRVAYMTPDGESAPSDWKNVKHTSSSNTGATTLEVELPDEAIGWKVYRYDVTTSTVSYPDELSRYKLLAIIDGAETTTYIDDGSVTPVTGESPAPQGRSQAGIIRDSKTGTIIQVNYPDNYGAGTATGVTDISMFRTRGGAYYQQHRAAYHTPEEFMTKVGFNPSGFTGKIYVSCISVVHPFDGYRGTLEDVVAVDATSLAPLDDLIVNKGEENEEVYKFFAINAPYSFITSGPNALYGLAIKKV